MGILVALASILIFAITPYPKNLGSDAWHFLGILFAVMVLWLTDALPKYSVTMILMVLLFAFGIMSFEDIYANFFAVTLVVVVGAFFLSAMLSQTSIPLRLLGVLLNLCKDNGRAFLAVIMIVTATISSVMADLTACIIMYVFVITTFQVKRQVRNAINPQLVKSLTMCIPIAAVLGGLITPVGVASNIVVIQMLEQFSGIAIDFLHWTIMMTPISIIGLFFFWLFTALILKPENIAPEIYANIKQTIQEIGPWTTKEKKCLAIILGMITLWLIGTWLPFFSTELVTILGTFVMVLPGMNLITREDFVKNASWDVFFMVAGINIISAAVMRVNILDWVINNTLANFNTYPVFLILILTCLIVIALHTLIPSGPGVVILMVPALCGIAAATGINPVVLPILCNLFGNTLLFLPLDSIMIVTYDSGQFNTRDLTLVSIPVAICMVVVMSLIVPLLSMLIV